MESHSPGERRTARPGSVRHAAPTRVICRGLARRVQPIPNPTPPSACSHPTSTPADGRPTHHNSHREGTTSRVRSRRPTTGRGVAVSVRSPPDSSDDRWRLKLERLRTIRGGSRCRARRVSRQRELVPVSDRRADAVAVAVAARRHDPEQGYSARMICRSCAALDSDHSGGRRTAAHPSTCSPV